MYISSMRAMVDQLILQSHPSKLYFIAEKQHGRLHGKHDHLVCFLPGLLALGLMNNVTSSSSSSSLDTANHHLLAIELTKTCNEFYKRSPSGLSPEIEQFAIKIPGDGSGDGMVGWNNKPNTGEQRVKDFEVGKPI